jgi:two-component system sensor histidine kinase AlgZ
MGVSVDGSFLPDFCAIRSVFAVVVSAELLAIVLTLAALPSADAFWAELSLRSLYVQWVALSVSALYCALRRPLARLSHALAGCLAWTLILAVTFAVYLVARRLDMQTAADSWLVPAQHLAIAGIIGAVVLRYLYEQYRERQHELAEARARLQALQARIRPHFLFNSMNTIASLTRVDPDLAEQVVQDLSDLFRASLATPETRSTLARELELARGYLRIEQQRLGDRLQVEWQLGELPLSLSMPPLILQPLLENAVYHGVETSTDGAVVCFAAHRQGRDVVITIDNPLAAPSATGRAGHRMAQDNVRQRLAAVFGDRGGMRVARHGDRYRVEITLPADAA